MKHVPTVMFALALLTGLCAVLSIVDGKNWYFPVLYILSSLMYAAAGVMFRRSNDI